MNDRFISQYDLKKHKVKMREDMEYKKIKHIQELSEEIIELYNKFFVSGPVRDMSGIIEAWVKKNCKLD